MNCVCVGKTGIRRRGFEIRIIGLCIRKKTLLDPLPSPLAISHPLSRKERKRWRALRNDSEEREKRKEGISKGQEQYSKQGDETGRTSSHLTASGKASRK
jgi:hypothetical protein